MNSKQLLTKIPFIVPEDVLSSLDASTNLSSKLNILRKFVHFNHDINHEKRLIWHKPILDIAKTNNLLESQALSLTNIVKIHEIIDIFQYFQYHCFYLYYFLNLLIYILNFFFLMNHH